MRRLKVQVQHLWPADENANPFPWVAVLNLLEYRVPLGPPECRHHLAALPGHQVYARLGMHGLLTRLQHTAHLLHQGGSFGPDTDPGVVGVIDWCRKVMGC